MSRRVVVEARPPALPYLGGMSDEDLERYRDLSDPIEPGIPDLVAVPSEDGGAVDIYVTLSRLVFWRASTQI